MSAEMIVFVPGIGAKEHGEFRTRLTDGMMQFAGKRGMALQQRGVNAATGRFSYSLGPAGGPAKSIDVQEVFWGDLLVNLSDKKAFAKFLGGLGVLLYWVCSTRVLQAIRTNKFLFLSSLAYLVIFGLWYYGAVAAALVAIGSPDGVAFLPIPADLRSPLRDLGQTLGSWRIWIFASALMAFLPVSSVVDYAYSTKRYFQNEDDMADKVQARVAALLSAVRGEAKHELITVVAYSFGAVPAVQALSRYASDIPIRLITLGAPLTISAARSLAVEKAVAELVTNASVVCWEYMYSNEDLMGSSPPALAASRLTPHRLEFSSNWSDKLTRKNHGVYFDCDRVFEVLLTGRQSDG
jgi:hypothetical protein